MASLESEASAWKNYRYAVRRAKAAAYTGVNATTDPVVIGGDDTASLSTDVANQQAAVATLFADELRTDALFAELAARPDFYWALSNGDADPLLAPFGYPKTKDLEEKIEDHELNGTTPASNVPGSAENHMAWQRQLDTLESFRKAYRQRIQRKQQLLTHKQFTETWASKSDTDFYQLLLNETINNNLS